MASAHPPAESAVSPDLEWARSGAMELTGEPDGPPRLAPAPLATRAREAVSRMLRCAATPDLEALDAAALLGERAAVFGHRRRGRSSPGGSCRLLRARDGWIALNLARPEDRELLPAWLGVDAGGEAWPRVAEALADVSLAECLERGRLLGLPVAPAADPPDRPVAPVRVASRGAARERGVRAPRVVDLSSLWAGPLCAHLLQLAGARVVKVESLARPDGARRGPARFCDLLNGGKASVALDFGRERDRERLLRLVEAADVVIESARPRALRQLGIAAEEIVAAGAGRVWVSLTGYGRGEPEAGWVAFGDDAAVAAGLAVTTGSPDAPLFCGDAIADPLAGLEAAAAALESLGRGGGELLDVSLRGAVAAAFAETDGAGSARVGRAGRGYEVVCGRDRARVEPPRARRVRRRTRPLGADTEACLC